MYFRKGLQNRTRIEKTRCSPANEIADCLFNSVAHNSDYKNNKRKNKSDAQVCVHLATDKRIGARFKALKMTKLSESRYLIEEHVTCSECIGFYQSFVRSNQSINTPVPFS